MSKKFIKKFLTVCFILNFLFISLLAPISGPISPGVASAADASCGGAGSGSQLSSSSGVNNSNAKVGGISLDQAAKFIAQMDDITGAYYDQTLDRIVFIGKKNTALPEFNKDDLAVAIKALFFEKEIPQVNIGSVDSLPTSGGMMPVEYFGGIENTKFGQVLFEADYELKHLTWGVDQNGNPVNYSVPGYKPLVHRYIDKQPPGPPGEVSRLWISPLEIVAKKDAATNSFVFDNVSMKVDFEQLSSDTNPLYVEAGNEFAAHVTEYYDDFAEDIVSWKEAKQLAKIVGAVKWIFDSGVATDFHWAADYEPAYVNTPEEIPVETVTQSYGGQTYTQLGGIIYNKANSYMDAGGVATNLKTASQAVNAPKEKINWTFSSGGQQYESVAVAADAFRSLGSYNTAVTDMSFPAVGDLDLQFSRSYSSFSGGQNGIGRGWDFLPAKLVDNIPLAGTAFLYAFCGSDGNNFLRRVGLAFTANGIRETFTHRPPNGGCGYLADEPFYHSNVSVARSNSNTNQYTITLKDQTKYVFEEYFSGGGPQSQSYYSFRLVHAKDHNGNKINYNYDAQNRVTSISDDKNHVITLSYNANNLVSQISDWEGRTVEYGYDGQGNLLTVTDPLNNITTYTYDTNNKLTSIKNREGQTVVANSYTQEAKVATQTDAANNTKTFNYDVVNRAINVTDNASPSRTAIVKYDQRGRILEDIDPINNKLVYTYGTEYTPLTIRDKNNNLTTRTYDVNGNLTSVTYPDNKVVTYTYNAQNRVTKISDGRYTPTKVTDLYYYQEGNQWGYPKDNLWAVYEAGKETLFAYYPNGELNAMWDDIGQRTVWNHDVFGNKSSEMNADNKTKYFFSDELGRTYWETDELNKHTGYDYDDNNNLIEKYEAITTPQVALTAYDYDKENRLMRTTLPNNEDTNYSYNAAGSLTVLNDTANNNTTYGYDKYQNLLSKQDALNRTTIYQYDKLNQLTKSTTPLGKALNWEYDPNGNIKKRIDENSGHTQYLYDAFNRLIKIIYPNLSEVVFSYDNRGNLLSSTSAAGVTTYEYDIFDRLTKVTDPNLQAIIYEYNEVHSLTKITYPGNKVVTYEYDPANRIKSVKDWNNAVTGYEYFENSLLKKKTLPNGVETSYLYDNANRLSEISHKKGVNILAKYNYTRNSLGNITSASESGVLAAGTAAPTPTPAPSSTPVPTTSPTPTPAPSGTPTTALLSQGKPIVASSQKAGYEATKANDGIVAGSYWEAQNIYPATLTVDLGSTQAINKVVMKLDWGTRTENVEILGSTDNSTFTTIVPAANYAIGNVPVTFNSVNTRYVRLKVNSNSAASAAQMAEFEVWGGSSATPTPTPAPAGGTEILNTTWTLSGNNGDAQNDKAIPANSLSGMGSAQVTFNLRGTTFGGGDDEASIIFIQNGQWLAANVTKFGAQNGLNGFQTITIPLSSFKGVNNPSLVLNTSQSVSNLHARFWKSSAFTVDISSVKLLPVGGSPAPTTTPTPLPTVAPTASPTPTPTSSSTAVELLSAPWNMVGNNGAVEKYQSISSTALQGKTAIRVTYDLHGLNALGGDASAIIFDQNGWKFVSLSNYGQNGLNGVQTVDIPLSNFNGLNPNAAVGTLHTRFWYGGPFTVDITSIKALGSSATPTPTPTAAPVATPTPVPVASPTPTPTPVSTSNVALNKVTQSSSNEATTLGSEKAVDGSTTTRWASSYSDPQWMLVDLGSQHSINRVKLNWEAAYGKSYQIQTSNDKTNWTTIYNTTTSDGGIDDLTISGTGRYVRMYGTQRGTPWGYSLWEFEVYGSPISQSGAYSEVKNYSYDVLGRILSAASSQVGNVSYTYDKVGNMLTSVAGGQTASYSYNNDNQLTQKGSTIFTYDNKGNQILKGNTALEYDFDNRMTGFTPSGSAKIEYSYDGMGNRLSKKVGGVVTSRYVNDLSGGLTNVLIEKDIPNNRDNYYLYGQGLISQGDFATGSRIYYLEDGLGNIRAATDISGSVIESYSYDPYGNKLLGNNMASFQFKGENFDPASGLVYMRARYYDPSTGRFISRDPLNGILVDPQSQNGYSYAHNNPIDLSDPSGLLTTSACVSASYGVPGLVGSCTVCVATSYHQVGVTVTPAGLGSSNVGGLTVGANFSASNANTIGDLAGPSSTAGVSALVFTGDYSESKDSQGNIVKEGSIGLQSPTRFTPFAVAPIPGDVHAGGANTTVYPIIDDTDPNRMNSSW